METPVLSPMDLSSSVYEPAEDSFLLLDALEQELDSFVSNRKDELVLALEVGCGSGIISVALAKAFQKKRTIFPCTFAIDVNPEACNLTRRNAVLNGLEEGKVQTILLEGAYSAMKCFREPFDIIVCNPPYVPIHPEENPEDKDAGVLEKAWSGGVDGNEFITPFLTNVSSMLKPNGVLYLLLSQWNNPETLISEIAKPHGLDGFLLLKRSAGRERLSVWRFVKSNSVH